MTVKVKKAAYCVGLNSVAGLLWLVASNTVHGQTAEAFYVSDVDPIVQDKCIVCHRSGGQASYTDLLFTSSAASNHEVFVTYVNSPTPGAKASRVLSKIIGALGHGGGTVISQGSAEYQAFSAYMDLLPGNDEPAASVPGTPVIVSVTAGDGSAVVNFTAPIDDGGATISSYTATSSPGNRSASCSASPCTVTGLTNGQSYRFSVTATNGAGEGPSSNLSDSVVPVAASVFRVALEEPVSSETHTGVGNLRGWAVSSDGIAKVEIYIDGVYDSDAPYGGTRGDVGGAFPDISASRQSGFSLAFNYSNLSAGPHRISALAYNALGDTKESAADFEVVRFDSSFIASSDAIDLSQASCAVVSDGISIVDALVEESVYDLRLKWRTAEQGFEIVEIR
jgi:hypothetical protein